MKSTDSEQEGVGMELEQYRNRLEQMVEEKSKDLIANQANYRGTHSLSKRFQQPLFLQQQQHSQHNGYVQAILQWRFFLLRICDADLLRGNYLFRHLHPLQLCTADQCPADRTVQRFFHPKRWGWRHLFHSLL